MAKGSRLRTSVLAEGTSFTRKTAGSTSYDLVSCPRNSMYFVAIKMGRRQGARSGAYLNRYVTDEQRRRRPIFIATLRAGASWLFFCVALSARMIQILGARSRLEKQPTDFRQNICYFGDRTLVP